MGKIREFDITEAYEEHQERLLWLYRNAKKGVGIDIGSNTGGTLAIAMAQRNEGNKLFYEETEGMAGIDNILWYGAEFRDLHPNSTFVCMDVSCKELPFESNHFDTVLLCETLEHIYPHYCHMLISEAYRISKGVVLITVPDGTQSPQYCAGRVEHVMHCMIWTEEIMRYYLGTAERKYKYEFERDGIFIYVKIFKE